MSYRERALFRTPDNFLIQSVLLIHIMVQGEGALIKGWGDGGVAHRDRGA